MILQRYFHWNTYGNPYDLFENRYEKKGWTKVETSSEEDNGQKGRYFFLQKTIPN